MNKEEIKHFKALLRQGILRHKNILLDYKFQEELLNIIKGYENLQQENQQLKDRIDKVIDYVETKLRNVNLQYGIDNEFRQEYDDLLELLKEDYEIN